MVGRLTLDQLIGVQIPVPQSLKNKARGRIGPEPYTSESQFFILIEFYDLLCRLLFVDRDVCEIDTLWNSMVSLPDNITLPGHLFDE